MPPVLEPRYLVDDTEEKYFNYVFKAFNVAT